MIKICSSFAGITSIPQRSFLRSGRKTIGKIHALTQERNGIYNKIRRAEEPEKSELKEQAKIISQRIAPLRKELRCADRIWERSLPAVQNLLDQERRLEKEAVRHKERSQVR